MDRARGTHRVGGRGQTQRKDDVAKQRRRSWDSKPRGCSPSLGSEIETPVILAGPLWGRRNGTGTDEACPLRNAGRQTSPDPREMEEQRHMTVADGRQQVLRSGRRGRKRTNLRQGGQL